MLIQLDESKTLYHQIYATIKDRILNGVLPINAKMLSSRELATQLSVSRNIVLLAYEQLIAEGYLVSRPGAGTFVPARILVLMLVRSEILKARYRFTA